MENEARIEKLKGMADRAGKFDRVISRLERPDVGKTLTWKVKNDPTQSSLDLMASASENAVDTIAKIKSSTLPNLKERASKHQQEVSSLVEEISMETISPDEENEKITKTRAEIKTKLETIQTAHILDVVDKSFEIKALAYHLEESQKLNEESLKLKELDNVEEIVIDYEKCSMKISDEETQLTDFEWEILAVLSENEGKTTKKFLVARASELDNFSPSQVVNNAIKGLVSKFAKYPDILTTKEVGGRDLEIEVNKKITVDYGEDEGEDKDDKPDQQSSSTEQLQKVDEIEEKKITAVTLPKEELPIALARINAGLFEHLGELDREFLLESYFKNSNRLLVQIDQFSQDIIEFKEGNIEIPSATDIIADVPNQTKIDLVSKKLRGLALLSVANPNDSQIKTMFAWGKQINDLKLLAGGGELGNENVYHAIGELDDLSRAIVLSQLSMSKRYELLKVGLDEINEQEMAFFINTAVYSYGRSGDTEDLEEIVITAADRDESLDQFSARRVMDALYSKYEDGFDYIIRKLFEASRQSDFGGHLMTLLRSHPATEAKAHELQFGYEDEGWLRPNRRMP